MEYEVFQESNFYYLFGVQELNYCACIELDTGKTTLFAPRTPISERIFTGPLRKAEIAEKYGLSTMYQSKLEKFVTDLHPVRPFSHRSSQWCICVQVSIRRPRNRSSRPIFPGSPSSSRHSLSHAK